MALSHSCHGISASFRIPDAGKGGGGVNGHHRGSWLPSLIGASAKSLLRAGKALTEYDSYADDQEQPYR